MSTLYGPQPLKQIWNSEMIKTISRCNQRTGREEIKTLSTISYERATNGPRGIPEHKFKSLESANSCF